MPDSTEDLAGKAAEQMTVAGVAWKKFGEELGLVVLGRGPGGGEAPSSSAALTVFHGGRSYRFDGRVSVPSASASGSKRTYRFEFRLPRRVQRWPLERLLLRWQGAEFELPLPATSVPPSAEARAQEPAAPEPEAQELPAPEPAAPEPPADEPAAPEPPTPENLGNSPPERYGSEISEAESQLNALRQEIERVRSALDQIARDTEQARAQQEEAQRERDRAREERDRAQEWLASVAGELEHVERELAARRGELEHVVRELATRRIELERLEGNVVDFAPDAGQDLVGQGLEPGGLTSPHPRPTATVIDPGQQRTMSPAERQVTAALSEVRKQIERMQHASEAPPPDDEARQEWAEPQATPPPPQAAPPQPQSYDQPPEPQTAPPQAYAAPPAQAAPPHTAPPEPAPPPDAHLRYEPPAALHAPQAPPAPQPRAEPPIPQAPPPTAQPEPPAAPAEPLAAPAELPGAQAELQAAEVQAPLPPPQPYEVEAAPPAAEVGDGAAMRFPTLANGTMPAQRQRDNWFCTALQRLADQDHEAGGRVLVSLLPAQAIATPRFLRYDLIVRELGIYAIDVDGLGTRIEPRVRPRPLGESEAWITAGLAQLGELAGRGKSGLLGKLRRYPVTVEGERGRVEDLIALARTPLRLRDLCQVGAQIEVPLLLRMLAGSIPPEWTLGERFTVRFEPTDPPVSPCYLRVNDGSPPGVTSQLPLDRPATTVRCSAWALIHLLASEPVPEGEKPLISGAAEPLALLRAWIQRLEGAAWAD